MAEAESTVCTPSLRNISKAIVQHHKSVAEQLTNLTEKIDLIADRASPAIKQQHALTHLPHDLSTMTEAMKALASAFSFKTSLEARLAEAPTVDDLVSTALSKTALALERMQRRLTAQEHLLSGVSLAVGGVFGSCLEPEKRDGSRSADGSSSPLAKNVTALMRRLHTVDLCSKPRRGDLHPPASDDLPQEEELAALLQQVRRVSSSKRGE